MIFGALLSCFAEYFIFQNNDNFCFPETARVLKTMENLSPHPPLSLQAKNSPLIPRPFLTGMCMQIFYKAFQIYQNCLSISHQFMLIYNPKYSTVEVPLRGNHRDQEKCPLNRSDNNKGYMSVLPARTRCSVLIMEGSQSGDSLYSAFHIVCVLLLTNVMSQ